MSGVRISRQALVRSAVAAGALAISAVAAQAGGLSVHEQSTSAQGSSWAGSAAGGDLSSMFWNPAAAGIAPWGFYTESHYALIIPDATLTGTSLNGTGLGLSSTADIGNIALVPASYGSYRINKDLVLGLSINSPFGLSTKPDPFVWAGSFVGQSSRLFTANATPTLSYQIMPGLFIGAGVQLEYAKLVFKFADSATTTAILDAKDDLGIGFTAGLLWQPTKSTSVGLGFRSNISHEMDGSLVAGAAPVVRGVSLTLETPEMVTLSVSQAIARNTRLLGTIEWTNWSRFQTIPISNTVGFGVGAANAQLEGHWHDGWLYSLGLEYDYSQKLTLRTGVAFEKSPIQNPTERLIQVPDSDRWWVSGGLTYRITEKMSMDLAYSHVFFDDAPFLRQNTTHAAGATVTGSADQSADIVSVSIKNKW
jgi:long-chain fatty acid transport protein